MALSKRHDWLQSYPAFFGETSAMRSLKAPVPANGISYLTTTLTPDATTLKLLLRE